MRHLFLLRHAKSSWGDPSLADFDRPLNGRGRQAAVRLGLYLRDARVRPEIVLCSAARRTRETWDLIEPALAGAAICIDPVFYEADSDALLTRLRRIEDRFASALLIAHNPGLADLAGRLAGGAGDPDALSRLAEKYPTAGLAALETNAGWADLGPGTCRLMSFTCPADLKPN
jgi:phosphohistidine phosphatase